MGQIVYGNYGEGIVVQDPRVCIPNICEVLAGADGVIGELAAKVMAVMVRECLNAGPKDGVVSYKHPDPKYVEYFKRVHGFFPRIFVPRDAQREPLNLTGALLADSDLLMELGLARDELGWREIDPFIMTPGVYEVARRLNLNVPGMDERLVRAGLVSELNDKLVFKETCRRLGIATPLFEAVRGFDQLVAVTERLYRDRDRQAHDGVMLRQATAAGGLGNRRITEEALRREGCKDVLSYLEKKVRGKLGWDTNWVVAEHLFKKTCSPSGLCFIEKDGTVRFVAESLQILDADDSYIGSLIPSYGLPSGMTEEVIETTMLYSRDVSNRGGRGFVNIDFFVPRSDGRLMSAESNFRRGGTTPPLRERDRLCNGASGQTVIRSSDVMQIPLNASFDQVLGHLDDHGIGWNPKRGEGVIVSIPPVTTETEGKKKRSMGYVVLARTHSRANELAAIMAELEVTK